MTADLFNDDCLASIPNRSQSEHEALLRGEILLSTRAYSAWGGAVTASMYLPLSRSLTWQQLTDYPRWVQYFPDLVRSEVLQRGDSLGSGGKRLYQVANKAFLFFTAQVEVYLRVVETVHQKIQFRQEQGSFTDFAAELTLQDYRTGTLLAYSVQATPAIPVPTLFVQQAIQLDLPTNMRQMRQVLCVK
ncbi:cyclase [Trichocoleus desertorum AS-A10]|uniref:SRPBCC family protein n=1 Tax=Trichocoleus desertorum TaxID=1481672 RepID=UPI0032991D5D